MLEGQMYFDLLDGLWIWSETPFEEFGEALMAEFPELDKQDASQIVDTWWSVKKELDEV